MPIADYPVKLTGPETHRLADMAGVQMDLRTVAATCAKLGRKIEREREERMDMLVAEAMQAHALIRYGRCFRGGVRTAFLIPAEWIGELPADLHQAHADFLDLRDKHIAHSVNDWELNVPVARVRVDQETGAVNVGGVSVNQHRVLMLAREAIDTLWRLAKTLADRVDAEMKIEQERLIEYAKAIPVEELKRRIREDPADIPGTRKPGNARGRE
jgi:hypothetical protein